MTIEWAHSWAHRRMSPENALSRWTDLCRAHRALLGAESAIALLERISPALENVDSSSGAIGTAVNHTIAELVPAIVAAPADARTRELWLERLFEAHGSRSDFRTSNGSPTMGVTSVARFEVASARAPAHAREDGSR